MGYSPWGHQLLDTTERLHFSLRLQSVIPQGKTKLPVTGKRVISFLPTQSLSITENEINKLVQIFKKI